jgi:Domain of unknown function (DUF4062)
MAQQSRTFRVFISSTFADFKAEREALQSRVFPKLRELCTAQGCRFQAIDLRWGVSEEAALDQQAMVICLEELRRCQRTTPRPNFVILMGQRYGWRPLPPYILAQEFAELKRHVPAANRSLLTQWYGLDRPDSNAVPPQYWLQPRRGRYEDPARWAAVESELHSVLAKAAQAAGLSPRAQFKYEAAATHQEIEAGALKSEDPGSMFSLFFEPSLGCQQMQKSFWISTCRGGRNLTHSNACKNSKTIYANSSRTTSGSTQRPGPAMD